jgi:hypothetical protein
MMMLLLPTLLHGQMCVSLPCALPALISAIFLAMSSPALDKSSLLLRALGACTHTHTRETRRHLSHLNTPGVQRP